MKSKVIAILLLFAAVLAANVASVLFLALPFKWLWNALLMQVIPVSPIGYLQSTGLLGLVMIVRIVINGVSIKATMQG
jgi:hypothetical protein